MKLMWLCSNKPKLLGVSLAEWVATSLEQQYGSVRREKLQTELEKEAARQRFRSHAGAVNLDYATGADNESIDIDLVRAYSDNHQEIN